MDIEKILYEKGLLATISDNRDREYVLKCTEELDLQIDRIDFLISEIQDEITREEKIFKTKLDQYFRITDKICLNVKKYNDTLSNDSIWGTVLDENERKQNLKKYYSHISSIRELTFEIVSVGLDMERINEILHSVVELKKKNRLCEIASDIIDIKSEKFGNFDKRLDELEKILEELINSEERLSLTIWDNERVLENYITALDTSLDIKSKGSEMNISSARKSVAYFLAVFKSKLK